jgi:hypothetical protein
MSGPSTERPLDSDNSRPETLYPGNPGSKNYITTLNINVLDFIIG